MLLTVSVDADLPSHSLGGILYYSQTGEPGSWHRNQGVNGIHQYDARFFDGNFYVSAEGYDPGNPPYIYPAVISKYGSSGWEIIRKDETARCHYAMIVFQDRLFVQPKSEKI